MSLSQTVAPIANAWMPGTRPGMTSWLGAVSSERARSPVVRSSPSDLQSGVAVNILCRHALSKDATSQSICDPIDSLASNHKLPAFGEILERQNESLFSTSAGLS